MGVLSAPRRVSVVVPTNDRPAYLREALASIRALEGEDLSFEILVGDNGSNPETRAAVDAQGGKHFIVKRPGAGAARNAALRAATGEFIAFLDDDDVWRSENIRAHLALLDARPEIEAVFGQVVSVDPELRPLEPPWPQADPGEGDALVRTMLSGYYPQLGATVVRASVREDVGLFDETLLGDQDWDWHLRIARRRRTAHVRVPSVLFRQRPPGSYDALRMRRIGFGRRVFLRHAIAEVDVFSGPVGLLRAYRDVFWQYWDYFAEAAVTRAESGDAAGARRALVGAFRVFPLRAALHCVAPRPLRRAAWRSVIAARSDTDERGA